MATTGVDMIVMDLPELRYVVGGVEPIDDDAMASCIHDAGQGNGRAESSRMISTLHPPVPSNGGPITWGERRGAADISSQSAMRRRRLRLVRTETS